MATIKVKQGAGDNPRELVEQLLTGQKLPFVATLTHKGFKPLVVPSTGICEVIAPNVKVPFKVVSFEQLWTVVTDGAALAKRYERTDEDFIVIEGPEVVAAAEPGQVQDEAPAAEPAADAATTKVSAKAAAKAATAASE